MNPNYVEKYMDIQISNIILDVNDTKCTVYSFARQKLETTSI